ncbi:PAS domain S-box protein [Streptomyces sp. NPDC005336]|uniref:PAS domain S-box protein n=1 Tax=Streptomyces sp. NPDC005336 TaxID=3157035 RepID=UPI0033AA3D25
MTLISSHNTTPGTDYDPGPGCLMAGRATTVLDSRRRFVAWSREAETMFGFTSDEVQGRPSAEVLGEVVADDDAPTDDHPLGEPARRESAESGGCATAMDERCPWH